MQISVTCHFWTLGFAMCMLSGGCPFTAWACFEQQLLSSSKASCRRQHVLAEDAIVGCALTYPKQEVLSISFFFFFFFFVYDDGKSRAEKGWWQGGSSIYLTFTMLYWSSCHLEKLKVVDLWLKCVTGVGVLWAKSLKWGLLLCEGISCPVLDVAFPILEHV